MHPRPGHVPLRIEWTLSSAWVPPAFGLHLDGLVARVVVERALAGVDASDVEAARFDELIADLPFSRFAAGDDAAAWVWTASLLQVEVVGSERRYMTTKTPVHPIAEYTDLGVLSAKGGAKVDTVRGLYKAGSMHYTLEYATKAVAWCVGDPDWLADLLGDVDALGGKTRLGHGRVHEVEGQLFQMDEDPMALEHWKLRNMPVAVDGYAMAHGPLRSPYWRRERARDIWRPRT